MRSARILAIVAAAAIGSRADAKPVAEIQRPPASYEHDFWREVTAPNHVQVDAIVTRARAAFTAFDAAEHADFDPGVAVRQAAEREVLGMLRYARRLQPDNLDVLKMIARAADDTGDPAAAREALLAVVDQAGLEHAGIEVLDRLGELALRAGRTDDAIAYLRHAQGSISADNARAPEHYATALALAGRGGEAIDALVHALPEPPTFELSDQLGVGFALVVQYDRSEQRADAYALLAQMKVSLGDQLAPQLQSVVDAMHFAPAEDELYYRALLYEIAGDRAEARTEWLLYAACDGAAYRARALAHVAELAALPEDPRTPTITVPAGFIRHRIHSRGRQVSP